MQPRVTSDTHEQDPRTARASRDSASPSRPVAGRRDAVRALIKATARAEATTADRVIRSCRIGYNDVDEFVRGNQWLATAGLAKLAIRLGCDLDAFVALSTRDGETVPSEITEQLPRYRHPFTAARLAAGLSVKDLAVTSGVCAQVISEFERGTRITPGTSQRLCAVFPDNAAVTASVLAQVVLHPHAQETPLAKLFGEICATRKLSLRAAARELSMTVPGLSSILSGGVENPRPANLARLAQFMGLHQRDLAAMIARQPPPYLRDGAVLRADRLAAQVDEREAAAALGVPVRSLQAWENGAKPVPARHIAALRNCSTASRATTSRGRTSLTRVSPVCWGRDRNSRKHEAQVDPPGHDLRHALNDEQGTETVPVGRRMSSDR